MKCNAVAYKKNDLRKLASKIEFKANHPNKQDEEAEAELISRLYVECINGNLGSLLYYLREVQGGKEIKFIKPKVKKTKGC